MLMEPIKRAALIDEIVAQLEGLIADGRLKEGDRLPPETDLARQLGVGRGTVREALIVLDTRKMVVRSRRGTFVAAYPQNSSSMVLKELTRDKLIKLAQMESLFEARHVLEIELSALCAARSTDDDMTSMARCLEKMALAQQDEDVVQFANADTEFHLLIAQGSQNEVLGAMLEIARDLLLEVTRELVEHDALLRQRAMEHHRAIYDSIRREDPHGARIATAAHLADVRDAVARFREEG